MNRTKIDELIREIKNFNGYSNGNSVEKEMEKQEISNEEIEKNIKDSYDMIIKVLKYYVEMKEDYYNILALWIIGTYFYKQFPCYPYIFLNAMRGSAKTRTLKLVTIMSKDGQLTLSPTEASLFRTTGTLGIDEIEGIGNKEKQNIREILNAGYKKGIKVVRMRKVKKFDGEGQEPEYFEPYRPIIMANIWGMDEVLGDRCIPMVLEKSNNSNYTKKIENFEEDYLIKNIKGLLELCIYFHIDDIKNIYEKWNDYVEYIKSIKNNNEFTDLFKKIYETDINGRELELFMPLFIISKIISEEILEKTIKISKDMVSDKKNEQLIESRDVLLFDFISKYQEDTFHFYTIKELTKSFKEFVEEGDEDWESKWINSEWVGRALKRLNLVIDKRRLSKGIEVTINVSKAKEKIKIFNSSKKEDMN